MGTGMWSIPSHPLGYLRKRCSRGVVPPLRILADGCHKTARSHAHVGRVRNDPEPAQMPVARVILARVTLMMWLALATSHADTLVKFPNVTGHPYPADLLGYLARPDGPGPFPAVVVLHGCNGFSLASAAIADDLKSSGYVALTVDSLGPRDSTGECGRFFVGQEIDAYAALAHLSRLPFVDSNRVAVLGNSMGGSSALLAVQRAALEKRFDRKFRAASHTTRLAMASPRL